MREKLFSWLAKCSLPVANPKRKEIMKFRIVKTRVESGKVVTVVVFPVQRNSLRPAQ